MKEYAQTHILSNIHLQNDKHIPVQTLNVEYKLNKTTSTIKLFQYKHTKEFQVILCAQMENEKQKNRFFSLEKRFRVHFPYYLKTYNF